ncbi:MULTISPECIES: pyridoxamine 5'-phosphate oxidase family protein [Psychrobacter]|uniref:General stress protein n=2 Tax=Psychrobacter TaxID=497 RepID=A0A1G6U2M6_9GAMM|nr:MULTISPECIES: pyridoxamine 5'-phosphate oxidase family protein [Psychrobacter]KRU22806.1 general stress protein [Psychrobacter piscatorii]MBZ1393190.1 pyridoxamine 5'-phosphate oxidase family protein [Psychrobacter pacificensis]MDE0844516.1 pyridoxamine 5'-phosphate oxidase family protein [Psychrobacter pacificensis]SDD35454.1 General stress protein 26 [Psychrobacter pacificensis]GLR30402.1 general stress protein [Psychrobacter pacificensis]
MNKQEQIDKIQDVIKDVKFAMLSTVNSKGDVHAWPMTTSEASIGGKEIWFIGDKTSDVVKDIQNNQKIGLSYASKDEKDYVSVSANAELPTDKNKLEELWSPVYNAFFEHGKEDPNVQLIKVVPHGVECWLGGSSTINMFKMAAAALQDGKTAEDIGEQFEVSL